MSCCGDKAAGEWIKPCSAPDAQASSLYSFVRAAKFWQGEEDIEAGAVICVNFVLEYGSEVWACPSLDSERKLEQVQERAGRAILDLSLLFPELVSASTHYPS